MTLDTNWLRHLRTVRTEEAERYATAQIEPRFAEDCDSLDPYREDDSWQFRAAPFWGNPL